MSVSQARSIGNDLYYFAFGSNMNPRVLTDRRKVKPKHSFPAIIPGYYLNFDTFAFPFLEPSFASIGREKLLGPSQPAVHGVLHLITLEDMEQIKRTEGGGGYDGIGCMSDRTDPDQFVMLEAKAYDGSLYKCYTLIEIQKKVYHDQFWPSLRYMNLIETGAKEHDLDASYQQWLASVPRYIPNPALWSRLGKYVFIGSSVIIWFPLLFLMVFYRVLLKTRPPRVVYVVWSWMLLWTGIYYQYFIRPVFGNGAGEEQTAKPMEKKERTAVPNAATHHRVTIIGSGHTAAIYLARANMDPVMYEGFLAAGIAAGGQLTTTTEVENFPGFPDGLSGPELMDHMKAQSTKFGTKVISETISKVDLSTKPFRLWREGQEDEAGTITADAIVVATGATAKRMFIEGEDIFWQAGISACAVCDGAVPIFRKKPLAVVGGGDSACEEAQFLTKYASKVYMLVRRDKLRASKVMADRAMKNPNIEILWNRVPIKATGDRLLKGLELKDTVSGAISTLEVNGLFYAIGHKPNTDLFGSQLHLDETGYVRTYPHNGVPSSYTSVEGVFACGDVQDHTYRQAVTAAGSGCVAAIDCERWLEGSE
ncbi:thioredoxin-disulfide reductase [Kappamyces sp. JEL0680]|nr:thioredoxin-disulfide reductase [Kappamyces sp. JEL0680]